jgi:hypothetical protein
MQPAITSVVEFGLATAGASTLTLAEEMNSIQFTAKHFGHEYAFDVLTTGVSERTDGDGDYVQFQRLLSEMADGDGIHFEFRDQLHSGYGIVDSVTLATDRLTIQLAQPLDSIPGVTELIVSLDFERAFRDSLRDDLESIFEHESNKLKTNG